MIGNAIGTFFQRKNGKGGPLPPIPSLKGCIGFYTAKGLTNAQMFANPVWKDKSGKGNDLQMKNFAWNDQSGVNITDYPGALVFDGVDDYGICETFPILTKEKGYMVMALRKYITDPVVKVSSGLASKNVSPNYGAFCFEFSDAGLLNTRSFGKLTRLAQFPDLITWQCSENFNDIDILSGDVLDTEQLSVGRHSNNYANVALYSLVIINHDTTEEERQLVIDYWKKEFPELFTNS